MALMDVAMTVLYAAIGVTCALSAVVFFSHFPVLLCCGESVEEQAAAERRAALEAAYALAQRRLAFPEPVELTPVATATAASVVAKLGYFPYSAEGRRASEKLVWAICLEVFEDGEKCSEVPACQRLFHKDCIDVWMKTKTICPLCRGDIVAGSERLSAADDMV